MHTEHTEPFELDTGNPRHARAYLAAAKHFLSNYPQDWSADRLASVLMDEDNPDRNNVALWDVVKHYADGIDSDPYVQAENLIYDLAETILNFK
jgi:hypothetical protein